MVVLICAFISILMLLFSAYFGIALIKSEVKGRETPECIAVEHMGNRAHCLIIRYSEILSSPDTTSKALELRKFKESALRYSEDYDEQVREIVTSSAVNVKHVQFNRIGTE